MYALVQEGRITYTGRLPNVWQGVGRQWHLTPMTEQQLANLGWFEVVHTDRPDDTDTHTHEASIALVEGIPTVTWTQRAWTADELEARSGATLGGGFPVQRITAADDLTVGTGEWPTDQIVTLVIRQDSTGGHAITHGATLASGVTWSPGTLPGSETVTTWRHSPVLGWIVEGCWISVTGSAIPDTTDPTPGTLGSSAVGASGFTLTVTGATDAGGLHAQPFRFSLNSGSSWSNWQTSENYIADNRDPATEYTCVHQVRDAALNTVTGTPITVETLAADPDNEPPEWTATFTMGTPLPTSITATASAMATDDTAVTGYQVSYNGGSSWAAITPSGSVFTLTGTASNTYSTTQLRAVDGDGAFSDAINVPEYTLAAETSEVNLTYRSSHASVSGSMAATGVSIGSAGGTRSVLVLALFNNTTTDAVAPTGCTIGGVTATRDAYKDATAPNLPTWALFRAEVPSGTTADISVTGFTGGAPNTRAFHVWTADDSVTLTDHDTALWSVEGTTTTVSTVNGGFVVSAATGGFGAAGHNWSANVKSRHAVANHAAADGATTGGSMNVSLPIYRPFIVTAAYGSA